MPEPGPLAALGQHSGTIINALAFVLVAFLVTWFGLRPLTTALARGPANDASVADQAIQALPQGMEAQLSLPAAGAADKDADGAGTEPQLRIKPAPQARLARMVDLSEERTADILRKWARAEAEAAG